MIISPVSTETLERLVSSCVNAQKRFLGKILETCSSRGDYTFYNDMTGDSIASDEREIPETKPVKLEPERRTILLNLSNITGLDERAMQSIETRVKGLPKEEADKIRAKYRADQPSVEMRSLSELESAALSKIIQPNLVRQGSIHDSFFYDTTSAQEPEDGNYLDFELDSGTVMFREESRGHVQPVIDQCIEALKGSLMMESPDYKDGAKVEVEYTIDRQGRLTVDSMKRLYLEKGLAHTFTVNIPSHEHILKERARSDDPEVDAKLKSASLEAYISAFLEDQILEKMVRKNLQKTDHPEYKKFTIHDNEGNFVAVTTRCREHFKDYVENAARQLTEKLLEIEDVEYGGLFRVFTDIDDEGLVDTTVAPIELDPDKIVGIVENLPDTQGLDKEDRNSLYRNAARKHALTIMGSNLYAAGYHDFDRWFKTYEKDGEAPGTKVKGFMFTEFGEEELEDVYNELTEEIMGELLYLEETKPVPVHMTLTVETGEDARVEDLKAQAKRVFLKHDTRQTPAFVLEFPEAPKGKITDEKYLRQIAGELIQKVRSDLILRHMAEMRHPNLEDCFLPDARKKGANYMTEQGAEMLEDTINTLTSQLAVAMLQVRSVTPGHLKGMRVLVQYELNRKGELEKLIPTVTYFTSGADSRMLTLEDMSSNLSSSENSDRGRSEIRSKIKERARSAIIGAMVFNMYGSKSANTHIRFAKYPGRNAYFTKTDRKGVYALSCEGEEVFGEMVDNLAENAASQVMEQPLPELGGRYIMSYSFNVTGINEVKIEKQPELYRGRPIVQRSK